MKAIDVINETENFHPSEFPERALENTEARLLMHIQKFRTAWGQTIHPSRHSDGWARFTGSTTSRHYAESRLSDAGDWFPAGNVFSAWLLLQKFQFGGIGIYFDTNREPLQPGPMIHTDMREQRVLWCRVEGEYYKLNTASNQIIFLEAAHKYLHEL